MCGICGIVGDKASENLAAVKLMMDRMRHRGPDGDGHWQSEDGKVTFGHVRLAIVDASSAGAQPMHHHSGLHSIVNGEIYNYPDLRKELEPESTFASDCDSEVVLHGHAARGPAFISDMNGMFAMALYDAQKGVVLLARDRIGIKPLYYLVHEGQLIFASEIKALFAAIETDTWTIDRQGLSEYMTYQSPLGSNTLFKDVKQLRPGHIITVDLGQCTEVKQQVYWKAKPNEDSSLTFDDGLAAFGGRFSESVRRHLLSDVAVASYLSAGFDSASVFAQASSEYGSGLTAYTGRFDRGSEWYDETGPAGELADALGQKHIKVDIDPTDLIDDLDDITNALDEPRMGMGAFSQYAVAKRAAQDYKVILTGHGGDELFSGYPVFAYAKSGLLGLRKVSEAPHFIYFALSRFLGRIRPEQGRGLPVLWSVAEQASLTGANVSELHPWQMLDEFTADAISPTDRILLTYLNAYLPGLLIVEDKISMAHSLEARTPFLDNEMLDLSLSIPGSIKLFGGQLKAVVKQNARKILPPVFFEQPKRGFPTPLRYWLRRELADFMRDRLTGPDSYLKDVLDPDQTQKIVQSYQKSWRRHLRPLDEIQSHKIWQLLSLESWLRVWSTRYGVKLRLE